MAQVELRIRVVTPWYVRHIIWPFAVIASHTGLMSHDRAAAWATRFIRCEAVR